MTPSTPIQLLPSSGKLPRSERGRERETAILRVATRHFLKQGYGDTKLDAIAKEAEAERLRRAKVISAEGEAHRDREDRPSQVAAVGPDV